MDDNEAYTYMSIGRLQKKISRMKLRATEQESRIKTLEAQLEAVEGRANYLEKIKDGYRDKGIFLRNALCAAKFDKTELSSLIWGARLRTQNEATRLADAIITHQTKRIEEAGK